jgi:hypothetical protein
MICWGPEMRSVYGLFPTSEAGAAIRLKGRQAVRKGKCRAASLWPRERIRTSPFRHNSDFSDDSHLHCDYTAAYASTVPYYSLDLRSFSLLLAARPLDLAFDARWHAQTVNIHLGFVPGKGARL